MRWLLVAIGFCGAVGSVLAQTVTDEAAPRLIILASNPVICNVDDTRAIYCKGSNIPQTTELEWISPNGDPVEVRSNLRSRIYVEPKPRNGTEVLLPMFLKHLAINDAGNWTCRAGDELSQTFTLYVGEKVNITPSEASVIGDEEKSIKLVCDAKGYPEPIVQWYKDNKDIETDPILMKKCSINKRKHQYTLEITHLDHTDPGTYMCKANQQRLSHFAQKIFHLNVRHKPVITSEYTEREVYAIMNEIKNITCKAQAFPSPKFMWAKRDGNKGRFDQSIADDMVYTADDGTYSVLMLSVYNESALGEYKCSVSNTWGKEYIIFHVSLGDKPSPPTSVVAAEINAFNITFNVTCEDCLFNKVRDGMEPGPHNLTVLGYNFQLVPCQEGIEIPYWLNATEFVFTIENANETLFTVSPLVNATRYHARVATRNAAGLSDWLAIHPNPKTKDDAAALTVPLALLIIAFLTTRCY